MLRKLKQTDSGLIKLIPDEIRRVNAIEVTKKEFKNIEGQKLIMSIANLSKLLFNFKNDCLLVSSNEDYMQQISMLYFDTPELKMYFEHHNRVAHKFRVYRKYKYNTGKSQLIIKHTDNKHISHQTKRKTKYFNERIPLKYFDYINKKISHPAFQLKPVLNCEFNRYTFANLSKSWLISVDTELVFWNDKRTSYLSDLAVLTIKTKDSGPNKEITNALKIAPVLPYGLNKFSIGVALTNPNLKQNMLKQKIHHLKRISNDN